MAGLVLFVLVALPAILGSRRPALPSPPADRSGSDANDAPDSSGPNQAMPVAPSRPPDPPVARERTRATAAWELSQGAANPHEAAAKIHELLKVETDERVRCEIVGAASTLDATPALQRLFEESASQEQPSRVRQMALDLWLTVYPDEAPAIARRYLTDSDEEVRGIAEEYFLARREESKPAPGQ